MNSKLAMMVGRRKPYPHFCSFVSNNLLCNLQGNLQRAVSGSFAVLQILDVVEVVKINLFYFF